MPALPSTCAGPGAPPKHKANNNSSQTHETGTEGGDVEGKQGTSPAFNDRQNLAHYGGGGHNPHSITMQGTWNTQRLGRVPRGAARPQHRCKTKPRGRTSRAKITPGKLALHIVAHAAWVSGVGRAVKPLHREHGTGGQQRAGL